MDKFDPVGDVDIGLWSQVLLVNLTGPVLMSKVTINHFPSRSPPTGSIVNIGSISSIKGAAAGTSARVRTYLKISCRSDITSDVGITYTASKHRLLGFTKHTAASYAKSGIRCNMVMPGVMKTDIILSMSNTRAECPWTHQFA
jgi:NAD(P)-dependent dehydrogenase (short-subunit alcohol dehydrogenase family)